MKELTPEAHMHPYSYPVVGYDPATCAAGHCCVHCAQLDAKPATYEPHRELVKTGEARNLKASSFTTYGEHAELRGLDSSRTIRGVTPTTGTRVRRIYLF